MAINRTPVSTWLAPLAGWILLGVSTRLSHPALQAACAAGLIACVLAAVHHAEVVAHRVGEPLGTLVLALAVTIIEVALIVSLMLSGGEGAASLARDTVFAAVLSKIQPSNASWTRARRPPLRRTGPRPRKG